MAFIFGGYQLTCVRDKFNFFFFFCGMGAVNLQSFAVVGFLKEKTNSCKELQFCAWNFGLIPLP